MKQLLSILSAITAFFIFSSFTVDSHLHAVKVNGKWGFIDNNGTMIIEPRFDIATSFFYGMSCVKVGDKWGFIDTTGKMVIEPKFSNGSFFMDGLAAVLTDDNVLVYIDKKGKTVISEPPGFYCGYGFYNGFTIVKANDKWGYMDKKGNIVIKPQFEKTSYFHEGLAAVMTDGKWGFINKKGAFKIKPQFDDVDYFSEGLCAVKINNKYGYINNKGEIVIEPKFDDAKKFSECLAAIMIDGKWGYIDKKGNISINPNYTKVQDFSESLASVETGQRWGYIDKIGEMVIAPTYTHSNEFCGGLAYFETMTKAGYINKKGAIIFEWDNDNNKRLEGRNHDVVVEEELNELGEQIFLYHNVDVNPSFPGGEKALYQYISDKIQYPELARNDSISGNVIIKFVIEKDGSITNPIILRDIGGGCGIEALRVIRNMPKWIPGKKDGKNVRTEFILPIVFSLEKTK